MENIKYKTLTKDIKIFIILNLLIYAVYKAFTGNPDNDMWWMMTTGRYIWNNGIPKINPFVIHENLKIVIQQPFVAVLNYLTYEFLGKFGLAVLSLLMYAINILLIRKWSNMRNQDEISKFLACVIGMICCSSYLNTRPTQLTITVLLLEQIVIQKWKNTGKTRYLIWLPLMSVVGINIQAALWPYFFIMLLPYLAPCVWQGIPGLKEGIKSRLILLGFTAISAPAGMLNVNGLDGMLYLFKSIGGTKIFRYIEEMHPVNVFSFWGVWLIMSIVILSIHIDKIKENEDSFVVYMLSGVIILSAVYTRNVWTLLFGLIPAMPFVVKQYRGIRILDKLKERLVLSLLYLLVFTFGVQACLYYRGGQPDEQLPDFAAEYLNEITNENIVLFTDFNLGGYMEWHGYKVYMDARPELFQKKMNGQENIADEYVSVYEGVADYKEFLEKYNFTHILVEKNNAFYKHLIEDPEYIKKDENENCALFEKDGCVFAKFLAY